MTGFALRNQPLVFIVVIALVATSLSVLDNFPSQEDPPITVREAVVTTFLPGMDADDIIATAGVSFLRDGEQVTLLDEHLIRNAP